MGSSGQIETAASQALYQRGRKFIPGGTHSDSRGRAPHPLYFADAQGAWVRDIDGNRYLDCIMGNGAVMFGYRHPAIEAAIRMHMEKGLITGLESELSISAGEKLLDRVRTAEMVRFATTGTEAAMHAIAMARAHTGKTSIAKPEGSYHGWYDHTYVSAWPNLALVGDRAIPNSVAGTAGLDPVSVTSTVVLPFNDIANSEIILRKHAADLAAVILEPIMIDAGWIPATDEYMQFLCRITQELGILLIMDELLTGFRVSLGGCQQTYGITPDLSLFGKALANGYILSAVAGKRAIMDADPSIRPRNAFVGTFNGHQLSLAICDTVLDLIDARTLKELEDKTESLISEFAAMANRHGVPARICGGGGHFHWYFLEGEIHDFRSAAASSARHYGVFQNSLSQQGVLCTPGHLQHHCLSTSHGDEEISFLLQSMNVALEQVAHLC